MRHEYETTDNEMLLADWPEEFRLLKASPAGRNGVNVMLYRTPTSSILVSVDCRGPKSTIRGSLKLFAMPHEYEKVAETVKRLEAA